MTMPSPRPVPSPEISNPESVISDLKSQIHNPESAIQNPKTNSLLLLVRRPRALLAFLALGAFLGPDLAQPRQVLGLDLGGGAVLAADGVIHLLAVDADLPRGGNPQTHLVPADVHHGDLNVVPDHDRFIPLSGQHQHAGSFLGGAGASRRPPRFPRDIPVAARSP